MIDKLLQRYGVGWALALLVLELTYINSKSLHYLVQGLAVIDMLFGVIGAVAFSMVTVLIMRLSRRGWLKVVFPLFDVALVLCGFNLRYADELLDNPVRFWLTVFLALFTGLITYSLGQINAEQHDSQAERQAQQRINELIDKLHRREQSYTELQVRHNELTRKIDETERILADTHQKLIESTRKLAVMEQNQSESKRIAAECSTLQSEVDALRERNGYLERVSKIMLRNSILYEAWLATKKRSTNQRDAEIIKLAEMIRQGQPVELNMYEKVLQS
ncbi:hypothetical protein [Tenuifilum osseticum]|uniref:hypothetical protein n=1 Tax=Tenuifilum TaxID=2760873 RepID=UPI0034E45D78